MSRCVERKRVGGLGELAVRHALGAERDDAADDGINLVVDFGHKFTTAPSAAPRRAGCFCIWAAVLRPF